MKKLGAMKQDGVQSAKCEKCGAEVTVKEAGEAIREIIKELDKKPIVIKILNIRVDTARDLVFKIYNKTNDIVKSVILCENLIVYGNRYRSTYQKIDEALEEPLFSLVV